MGQSHSDITRHLSLADFTGLHKRNAKHMARKTIAKHNPKVDAYWADVRAKEIQDALAAQKRSTKKSKPKPKPKPKAAPSSAAPSKPYENIPGVDSYVPRKRSEDTGSDREQARDRISNYTDFSANDWIAEKSRPEGDIELAQSLADKYKFEIRKNLKPSAESIVNALDTAIPS